MNRSILYLTTLMMCGCLNIIGAEPPPEQDSQLCKTEACDYCRPLDQADAGLVLQPVETTLSPDPHTGLSCEVRFPNGSLGWCCPSE